MNIKSFEDSVKNLLGFAFPCKAKVQKSYIQDKKYFCDCLKLNADDSQTDIIIPLVRVPKIWGLLEKDTAVNISFYDGNPHLPFVASVDGIDYKDPVDLYDLIEKLLDLLINLKTFGDPANHAVHPDIVADLESMRDNDLKKVLK